MSALVSFLVLGVLASLVIVVESRHPAPVPSPTHPPETPLPVHRELQPLEHRIETTLTR